MHRHFVCRKQMELYLIEDYKEIHPGLKGPELTDALVLDLLRESGKLPPVEETPGHPVIERLPGGKPVLKLPQDPAASDPPEEEIHFSVSHTNETFGCVIAEQPIGFDLQVTRSVQILRMARRYFTADEISYLEDSGEDASVLEERFFRLWTRKEAYAKLTGEGLTAVLEGAPVTGRDDLVFTDMNFGDGLYGCICTYED